MTNPLKKITYNSPVVLTYAAVCVVFLIINAITNDWFNQMFLITRSGSLLDPFTYIRAVLYIFGHANFDHLVGNMIMLLLVGPIVEERYGSWNLTIMIFSTGIVSAVINNLFTNTGVIGASGIVFMMIILCGFTNMQKGKIPLTLIIVVALYLGREIYNGIVANDNVSQLGHILGGVCGLLWGIYFYYLKFKKQGTSYLQ